MICDVCGGAGWFKTCRLPGGTAIVLCDPCWVSAGRLVIVPGSVVVMARCDRCGAYGNPRDYEGVRPAGRKDCLGGTCRMCSECEV